MQTLSRASIVTALAALLSTVAGAAAAHGPTPDDRPLPALPGPLVGAIEITNERDRPVQIYVDGRFAVEVRPRTTDVIERVPNGVRLVSYMGGGGRGPEELLWRPGVLVLSVCLIPRNRRGPRR